MASFSRNTTSSRRPGAGAWSVKPKPTASEFIGTYMKVYRVMKHKFDGSKLNYSNTTFIRDNKIGKVFCMMNEAFKAHHERHGNLQNYILSIGIEGVKTNNEGKLWIYDSRKSDKMPKNDKEYERFVSFMDTLVKSMFNERDGQYLCENMNIVASFFLLFTTTPGFYLSDKKLGLAKMNKNAKWTCIVIFKEPVVVVKKQRLEHNNYKTESHNDVSRIPKLKARVSELACALEEALDIKFEKSDGNFEIHRKVSGNMSESILGSNKYKKVHKMYQEYQKEKQKMLVAIEGMKTSTNFAGVELENGNVVTFKKVRQQSTKKSVEKAAEEVVQETSTTDSWEDIPDDWEDNSAW